MKIHYDIDRSAVFPNLERYIKGRYGNYSAYARHLGLHRTTVYNMMHGKVEPKWDTILVILEDTGMTFEEAFGGVRHVQQ